METGIEPRPAAFGEAKQEARKNEGRAIGYNPAMNWLIYHVASGQVFFTGMGLLSLAVLLGLRRGNGARRAAAVSWLIGVAAVTVSSTPLSLWYYVLAAVCAVAWRVVAGAKNRDPRRLRIASAALMAAVGLGVALELPHHFTPALNVDRAQSLVVFADSITAGVGDKTETWPKILVRTKELTIQDHSQMGATVGSTLELVRKTPIPRGAVVLLEIGGNDLLGTSTPWQFEEELNALLELVSRRAAAVVMFELPLPPLNNSWGRAQRRAAANHNVVLIPKRVLMCVLTPRDATLDTIHLTQQGQELMAEAVWGVIAPAFE